MPVTINGKVIRNVPEQVGKNKRDIHELILSIPTYGKSIELTMDSDYVMTLTLKDAEGHVLSHASVDLPLEATVVDGRFDDDTDSLILVLNNGNEIEIPVSGLIAGLVTTDTAQTITGVKTFSNGFELPSGGEITTTGSSYKIVIWGSSMILGKSLFPSTDSLFDIGSSSAAWKDLYLKGSISLGINGFSHSGASLNVINDGHTCFTFNRTCLYPSNYFGYSDIGSSSQKWKDLYLSGTIYTATIEDASAISFKINGVERLKLTGADAITGRLYPSIDNTFDLGTGSLMYKDIKFKGVLTDGTNTVSLGDLKALIDYAKAQGWIS